MNREEKFEKLYELLQQRIFDEKLINEAFEATGLTFNNQHLQFRNMSATEWKARAIIDFKNRVDD